MKITIFATLMIFLAYFLVLYGAVGFIQDKRFFSSAPKENLAAIPDRKERFRGAHVVGWMIEGIAILLFPAAAALSVWDGVRNDFGFLHFFARFLVSASLTIVSAPEKLRRTFRRAMMGSGEEEDDGGLTPA